MNTQYAIDQLQRNKFVFQGLLQGLPEELINWKPNPDHWNLLEIICHLYDIEREDFWVRLKHVLDNQPGKPPAFDPLVWLKERNYAEQDFAMKLGGFLEERERSIERLLALENPQWTNFYAHSTLGNLDGNFFLANWLAHDYLHIRQINRLKYEFWAQQCGEELKYAGNW